MNDPREEEESRQFCPRCGDSIPPRDDPLPGAPSGRDVTLCDACYFEDFDLVDAPERIEVRVCSGCGAVHRGNRWVDVGARDYTDVAIDEVTESLGVHLDADEVAWGVEPEQVDENTIRMHAHFTGLVRGTPIEEDVTVPVKISRDSCPRCGRIAGGYYASEIQVRAADRTPTAEEAHRAVEIAQSYVAAREADGDREAFVSEVHDTADGPDIRLSTNQIGRAVSNRIVDELGGHVDAHPTLVTEDGDGNEVYRVTYVARLPRFSTGDIVAPDDGGPVLVRGMTGTLRGTRLTTGEPYESAYDEGDAPEADRLATIEDAEETTVVTVEDEHAVQVLDPETYEAKTVPRPDFFDPEAATVPVVKSRAGLHIVPGDAFEREEGSQTD